jgi:hypothetical protein
MAQSEADRTLRRSVGLIGDHPGQSFGLFDPIGHLGLGGQPAHQFLGLIHLRQLCMEVRSVSLG